MEIIEKFKQVIGWEGIYEVSNLGRIRSLNRLVNTQWKTKKPVKGRLMKQHEDRYGYLYVHLRDAPKSKKLKVHRLVAFAFIKGQKETVNHIDGDKHNNILSNLEWATWTENNQHAKRLGLNYNFKNRKRNGSYK